MNTENRMSLFALLLGILLMSSGCDDLHLYLTKIPISQEIAGLMNLTATGSIHTDYPNGLLSGDFFAGAYKSVSIHKASYPIKVTQYCVDINNTNMIASDVTVGIRWGSSLGGYGVGGGIEVFPVDLDEPADPGAEPNSISKCWDVDPIEPMVDGYDVDLAVTFAVACYAPPLPQVNGAE